MTELFSSDNLLVRHAGGHGPSCCVVTFDPFTDFRTLGRAGFGEAFLDASGVDAIHVIPRENDWYQYPETLAAMAAIRTITATYDRVVTYGSSMGAYAAIRLAGPVGADAVLALSPQYSIDPSAAPWEDRWAVCSSRFRDVWEATLPLAALAQTYVVFDPVDRDRKHVALYARRTAIRAVPIRHAGHPVTGFLAEVGLLQEAILAVCRDRFDPAAFTAEAEARAPQAAHYLLTRADRTPAWRRARRIGLLRGAVERAPQHAAILCRLAIELRNAGQLPESLEVHRRAIAMAPEHPTMLFEYSYALERSGDLAGALGVMEEVQALTGAAPIYARRLEKLRARVAGDGPRRWWRRG